MIFGRAGLAVALVLVGCARTPRSSLTDEGVPGEAHVVCEAGGTTVQTPRVEPQADGVHVLVENPTEERLGLEYRGAEGSIPHVHDAGPGMTRRTVILAPGEARVRCSSAATDLDPEEGWATFEVVDERGVWVSPTTDCSSRHVSAHLSAAEPPIEGDPRDPVEIARESFDLRPGDEVRVARYPEAVPRSVILLREGRTLERVEYQRPSSGSGATGDGWIESGREWCSG